MSVNRILLFLVGLMIALNSSAATSSRASMSWWDDTPWGAPDRGFNWYPDPADEKVPEEDRKPEEKPKTIYEMTSLEEIKKELERLKGIAVTNPSESNVLVFLKAQNWVMDKASLFADVSRRVVWANPEVNYAARSPTANFALANVRERQEKDRSETIQALSQTHGLLFFAKSDCPFCHDQAPVLRAYSKRTGIQVLTVSLDGRPIAGFPDAKPDNGIAMMASGGEGVQVVPALYLIDRRTQQTIALGTGVITAEEISERIRVLTKTAPGQEF